MKTTKADSNPRASLGEYNGHSIVSVIRRLGKEGLKAREVALALKRFNPNMHTVYLQTGAGRRGEGVIADLSRKDIAALKAGIRAKKSVKKVVAKKTEAVAA